MNKRVLGYFLFWFCSLVGSAQHVPISHYTYENCIDIDNYWGITDSVFLKHNIHTKKVYCTIDSTILGKVENYKDGKKISVQEFNPRLGELERTIEYAYKENQLEAKLVHYPSAENFKIFPSRRFSYLERNWQSKDRYRPYKWDDTITHLVRMTIRHTWNTDGTISFEGFDKDQKLIDTVLMKPLYTWEEYQSRKRNGFPRVTSNDYEEYHYNEKGRITLYKDKTFPRETRYFYDNRDLMIKEEHFENGRITWTNTYVYESERL